MYIYIYMCIGEYKKYLYKLFNMSKYLFRNI